VPDFYLDIDRVMLLNDFRFFAFFVATSFNRRAVRLSRKKKRGESLLFHIQLIFRLFIIDHLHVQALLCHSGCFLKVREIGV
jgi:hypothetical protein